MLISINMSKGSFVNVEIKLYFLFINLILIKEIKNTLKCKIINFYEINF